MQLLEVIRASTAYLESRGVASARLQSELILAHVLGLPRLRLYLEFEREPGEAEMEAIREAVRRRGRREPLQQILGSTSFCGLEMEVTREVLVPRPETELLAERAWTWLRERAARTPEPPSVLDWGTGSGCLAIVLAVRVPGARVRAVDRSASAVDVARRNAERHGVASRVEFFVGDGLEAVPDPVRFDLVVGNPPYIPAGDIAGLEPEVRDHEPRTALDGGPDGLVFYRRLAVEWAPRLAAGGVAMVEFGDGQGSSVASIFGEAGWRELERHRDYSGRERFAVLQPGNPTISSAADPGCGSP